MKYENCLSLFNDKTWSECTVEQKIDALRAVENEMAKRQHRLPCEIKVYSEPPLREQGISLGQYSQYDKTISINAYQLNCESEYGNDYRVHLDTILHEGRHAYQHQTILGYVNEKDPELVNSWRENMKPGHYIQPEQNYPAYRNQPIEKDARDFAQSMSVQIEREKLQVSYEQRNAQKDSLSNDIETIRNDYMRRNAANAVGGNEDNVQDISHSISMKMKL